MVTTLISEPMKYKQYILERVRSKASRRFSGHALNSIRLEEGQLYDLMEHEISIMIEELAEPIEVREKVVIFNYPKDWINMFKKQYFPQWLLKKFPIKYQTFKRTVKFKKMAVYPKFPKVFPPEKYGEKILFRTMIWDEGHKI